MADSPIGRDVEKCRVRANPVIWRIAEWLCQELDSMARAFPNYWKDVSVQNYYYDKAKELQYKLLNNEFTGEDKEKD